MMSGNPVRERQATAADYGRAVDALEGSRPDLAAPIRVYVAALRAECAMLRVKANRLRATAGLEAHVVDRLKASPAITPAELGNLVVDYLRGRR